MTSTSWDRDVRACFAAMVLERGQRRDFGDRRYDVEYVTKDAIEAADIIENARRARAAQNAPFIGRCLERRMPSRGPQHLERCLLLAGHDDEHRFPD